MKVLLVKPYTELTVVKKRLRWIAEKTTGKLFAFTESMKTTRKRCTP
ncbi:MAG: hypothetical protein GY749_07695 [Desulfobacteraceae bacterium]|nr:hypothetical protein [Desulfobacteraceae bacterium]